MNAYGGAAESRAYSDLLDRETRNAAEAQFRREEIAESFERAWMQGQWHERIETFRGAEALAKLVSEDLLDLPDNPLYSILYIVRDAAYAGDPRAIAVIKRMAAEHAQDTVELSE